MFSCFIMGKVLSLNLNNDCVLIHVFKHVIGNHNTLVIAEIVNQLGNKVWIKSDFQRIYSTVCVADRC